MEITINEEPPEYLTVGDIMKRAQVCRTVAYDMAHKIGFTKIGKSGIRVATKDFKNYMKSRYQQPQIEPVESLAELERSLPE